MPDPSFEQSPYEDPAFESPAFEQSSIELNHPTEWLRQVEAEEGGLTRLLQESGSLSIAAQRLARARLGEDPSFPQLRCVAMELAERTGYYDRAPGRYDTAVECLQQGLGRRAAVGA